jgi:hypothetical protein
MVAGQPPEGKATDAGPKPTPLPVLPENIPAELKAVPHWVVWRYVEKPDKWDKPPLDARTGKTAKSTDPQTWATFAEAVGTYHRGGLDGIGFVVSKSGESADDIVAVDLDKCRNPADGAIEDWAAEIIRDLDSYTEVSPSGRGIRIFVQGHLPPERRRKGRFEIYETGRYVTVTGQRLPDAPVSVEPRQAQLDAVHGRVFGKKPPGHAYSPTPVSNGYALSDAELIEKAKQAANGRKFSELWAGGHGERGSPSEADLALCGMLAFWTGGDAERIDALFRQSGLFRDKWEEREDYRKRTIAKALEGKTEFYQPGRNGHTKTSGPSPKAKGASQPTEAGEVFALGPLTLRPENPRRSGSGKVALNVMVYRGDVAVDHIGLSSAAYNRREAVRQLAVHVGDEVPRLKIEEAVAGLLAWAAKAAQAPAPSEASLQAVLGNKVLPAFGLHYKTAKGAWSEKLGREVTKQEFCDFTPDELIVEATTATDAPPNRPALIRTVKDELGVLWATVRNRLPAPPDADIASDSAAAAQFRQAMVRLWTAPKTWDKSTDSSGQETMSRASLISRVQEQARAYLEGREPLAKRERWRQILPAVAAWWRPGERDGELTVYLGMRYEAADQIGVALPEVRDQTTFTAMGEHCMVLDPSPPACIPVRLSRGQQRLGVLTQDLTDELMATPDEEAEPGNLGDTQ